jgi:hypothetical protein
MGDSGIGELCWLDSCGVHVAGEKVNWDDGVEVSVTSVELEAESSNSRLGVLLRVFGKNRS